MHLALDCGWSADRILAVIRRLKLLPRDHLVWRELPAHLGAVKVDSLIDIDGPADHLTAVGAWAASVWAAWYGHHATIRVLADTA